MAKPIRILTVAPYPPRLAATHGGAKALGEFLAHSAPRHRVGLVYVRHADEPDLDEALYEKLDLVEAIPRRREPRGAAHLRRLLGRRARLLAGTPLSVSEVASPDAAAAVDDVVRRWRPDLIRLEPSISAAFVRTPSVPTVLVEHDPLLTSAGDPTGLRRLEAVLERRAHRRFDRRARAGADAVVVFTERDRAIVAAGGGAKRLVQIPLAIDPLPALDPVGSDDDSMLFVGNLNHPANRNAVKHAADAILPLVRTRRSGTTLTVVGERPRRYEPKADGLELTGLVDDVKPYLAAAAVFVAPLRTGGGMRVKVLEALSAGKAVVAYPEALDGVGVEHEQHVVVASRASEFADAVVRLLDDRDARERLGRAAREWMLANVSWEAVLEQYDELYRALLAER